MPEETVRVLVRCRPMNKREKGLKCGIGACHSVPACLVCHRWSEPKIECGGEIKLLGEVQACERESAWRCAVTGGDCTYIIPSDAQAVGEWHLYARECRFVSLLGVFS
jgi:hypothetical protein